MNIALNSERKGEGMELSFVWEEKEGGVSLLGVYGDTPSPVIPDQIENRPVIEIGRYCFAPDGRESEKAHKTGHFDGGRRIDGSFVESVWLPDGVKILDNAAFYNCRALHSLSVGTAIGAVGSDLFTNCWELEKLVVRGRVDGESGLKKLLAVISSDLTVCFGQDGEGPRLFYPEYFESMDENTPAHIFNYSISGQGYRYRQCFTAGGGVSLADYDRVFPVALPGETVRTLCLIGCYRVAFPDGLTDEAKKQYLDFLSGHLTELAGLLVQMRDTLLLERLAANGAAGRELLALISHQAAATGWNEGAAAAGELTNRYFGKKKKEYTF